MDSAPRSTSRPRPSSRPATPLRPSSRSSIRDAPGFGRSSSGGRHVSQSVVNTLEPQFAELADSMADLEANMMHLQLMHESLSRFSESFASFLYGLNMNAFCVDFPEAPIPDSFRRAKEADATPQPEPDSPTNEGETSILTTDTTFIDNPPASSKASSTYATPASARGTARSARGTATRTTTTNTTSRGRYAPRGSTTSARRGTSSSTTTRSRPRGVR